MKPKAIIGKVLIERLQDSEYWHEKTKINGSGNIENVICPSCSKPRAFVFGEAPNAIVCNRKNSCGARTMTRELFPDLLTGIEKREPPTPSDPLRPARKYLAFRGINKGMEGLEFEYHKDLRGTGSGGVVFPLFDKDGEPLKDGKGRHIKNGRLFNPPPKEGKTHNIGSTQNAVWRHPGITYDPAKEVFVTEAVVDALSLIEAGKQAVSVLAAGGDPKHKDLSEFPHLVLAFDGDRAGAKAFKAWKAAYPNTKAVAPTAGDWNDFLLRHSKDPKAAFEKERKRFEFNARLLLAETAKEYAETYREYHRRPCGLFVFDGCYWYAGKKKKEDDDSGPSKVSDFTLSVLYKKLDITDPERPEHCYMLKVKPKTGRALTFIAKSSEIVSESALRKLFISRSDLQWTGGDIPSKRLSSLITGSKAPKIRQAAEKGLDSESGHYIFQNFMVSRAGKFARMNGDGYYRCGHEYIKPAIQSSDLSPVNGVSPNFIFENLMNAWWQRSLTALGWGISTWFYSDVLKRLGFFPFMSLFGDSQTGKSNLFRILNAMQCCDGGEIPMRKASTNLGILFSLTERADLFNALLEETKGARSGFDFASILNAFDGSPVRVAGTITGTPTYTVLKCGLMFIQNIEPFESKPQKERVISLEFRQDQLDEKTMEGLDALNNTPREKLAWVYPFVMKNAPMIREKWPGYYRRAKTDLAEIKDSRIREVHALPLCFYRLFCELIGVDHGPGPGGADLKPFILGTAKRKILACKDEEITAADLFLQAVVERCESPKFREDIQDFAHLKDGKLYFRAGQCADYFSGIGSIALSQKDLVLNQCKNHNAFIAQKNHRFPMLESTGYAWVFDIEKIKERL